MIAILDCGSNKTLEIGNQISTHIQYKIIDFLSFIYEENTEIQGLIISGAPILITKDDLAKYLTKIKEILNLNIPVLGICFGHQLIGLHYGSIALNMKPDRNSNKIKIEVGNQLFNGLTNEIEVIEDHCEWITVPNNFKRIAHSNKCKNEAMMHEINPIFGVQFHPEVSGEIGSIILLNFIKICFSID